MNLVARQNYSNKKGGLPNTYIGGVASTISTPALLASKLAIDVSRITNFSIVGSDIQCKITGSYVIPYRAFRDMTVAYFTDSDNLVTDIASEAFARVPNPCTLVFKGVVSLTGGFIISQSYNMTIELENCTTISNGAFGDLSNSIVYIPRCVNLGTTSLNNSVFQYSVKSEIYCHSSLNTSNSGGVEGDLTDAISRGATVRYVTNFTAPNQVTTLVSGTVYDRAVQLNFTTPSSTNAIDYYDCWANGVLKNRITASGQHIRGLTTSTSYAFTIIAVDVFYNKSVVSNSVSVSTNSASYLGFRTIAAYALADGIDSKNGYNGTVGSSVTFSAGKNGNGANFIQNTNSKITIPYNSAFAFNNGTNDLPFSTSTWVKFTTTTNYFIFSKGVSNRLFELTGDSSVIKFRLASNGNISNRIEASVSFSPVVGTWYNIVTTYSGNKLNTGMNIYINGIFQNVTRSNFGTTYLGLSTANEPVYLGHLNGAAGYNMEGMLDENYWFNEELIQAEITQLQTSSYPF